MEEDGDEEEATDDGAVGDEGEGDHEATGEDDDRVRLGSRDDYWGS